MNKPFVAADWKGAKCEGCGGSKRVVFDHPNLVGDWPCPDCDETGYIPYNLAGLKWMPENDVKAGAVFIADSGEIFTLNPGAVSRKPEKGWDVENKPYLPSPDLINEQDNPREVAIAALERAGFEQGRSDDHRITVGSEHKATIIIGTQVGVKCWIMMDVPDPTLAQYAVDFFKVLKVWADAVKWGGK